MALPKTQPETQRRVDAAQRRWPDSVEKRRERLRLMGARNAIASGVLELARSVAGGKTTVDRAVGRAAPILTRECTYAFRRGLVVGGIVDWKSTPDQIDWLTRFVSWHLDHFRRFMQSLEQMGMDDRAEMYGGAADGAFWHGWLEMMPSNALIHWNLSVAEHCPGCIDLAVASPYNKPGQGGHPLPTMPRAGDTRCLTNCRCYLTGEILGSGVTSGPINLIGVEVTAVGGREIDPNSPEGIGAAKLYDESVQRYAYHLRMAYLEPNGADADIAAGALRAIQETARAFRHTVRLRALPTEILAPVKTASRLYRYVRAADLTDDLVELVATIIVIDEVDRGRIARVRKDPAEVTLEGPPERTFRLDRYGRAILFVEEQR